MPDEVDKNGDGWRDGRRFRGGLPENPDGTPYVLDFGPAKRRPRKPGAVREPRRPNRWDDVIEALAKQLEEDG